MNSNRCSTNADGLDNSGSTSYANPGPSSAVKWEFEFSSIPDDTSEFLDEFPEEEVEEPAEPPKRKRGRPPKSYYDSLEKNNVGSTAGESSEFLDDILGEELEEPAEPPKRKRGRPPQSYYDSLKKVRESKRSKRAPKMMNYETMERTKCAWPTNDKIRLLKALEEYGSENISQLKRMLPNKTKEEIMTQIRMWKQFARAEVFKKLVTEKKKLDSALVNCVSKLGKWIELFEDVSEGSGKRMSPLANVFLLLAEYGQFPEPVESNDVDYRAMYRYLHCVLTGQPHYGLNHDTAGVISHCITNLLLALREGNYTANLQPHLLTAQRPRQRNLRTYGGPRSKRVGLAESPEMLLDLEDINPLALPLCIFEKPDVNYETLDLFSELNSLISIT